jgi:thymidylate synthase
MVETIAEGWAQVLELYRGDAPVRIATRHGVSFDIPGLVVTVRNGQDSTPPTDYEYPELVTDYLDRLFGRQQSESLLFQRLRRWVDGDQPAVDQLQGISELLRADPNSRSAVFSTWKPAEDLGAPFPVSPVGGCFRLVGDNLHLFLTARSTDVMVGLVPELVAFSRVASALALEVGARSTMITYQCWSAHLYEIDYLSYLMRQ